MKKLFLSLAVAASFCSMASAQTLNVEASGVNYLFESAQTGIMEFDAASTLTIQGRTFNINEISKIKVTEESLDDNLVVVAYDGATASVSVAGNIAKYVNVSVSGADVTIDQLDTVSDDTCGEITYRLSGSSDDGSFLLNGSYKSSLELTGLTLTSLKGAPIDVENGKRIAIRVAEGSVNSLVDSETGSQKGCIVCKGHLEFKQKGTLNVTGRKSHGIMAKEYVQIKNTTINILSSAKDGINCTQYFLMESGTLNIVAPGDDGIQCDFKDAENREDEDTGTITIQKGTINIKVSANACKALKSEGNFEMSGGELTANVSGNGIWDSAKLKTKASACIGADGDLNISGGTLNLTATGSGGKGLSSDGNMTLAGGDITIHTTGGLYAYINGKEYHNYTGNTDNVNSDYKSSPKGIKCDSALVIDGGNISVTTSDKYGGEGIESKTTLTINGGHIVVRAAEDGTNSSSHTYINGGYLEVISNAGDAVDANGNIYVNGGTINIYGATSPEQGFDAGDGYGLYINGGVILACGGGNSTPTNSSQSKQAYVVPSINLVGGTKVTVSNGGETLLEMEVPSDYVGGSTTSTGGWGVRPGGQGGSNRVVILSSPEMVSGTTYTITYGTSTTTSAARTTGGTSNRF